MKIEELDHIANIPTAFFERARQHPDRTLYRQAGTDGSWSEVRAGESAQRVAALSAALRALGVRPGDRVAILSNTRPEWLEADLAILAVGGVVVSIYQSLLANDVGYILWDSDAKVVFAENQEQLEKLRELSSRSVPIPACEGRAATSAQITLRAVITFERTTQDPLAHSFLALCAQHENSPYPACPRGRTDLASLVYTSGTTGPAKGVMQTHHNHLSNVRQARQAGIYTESSTIFLLLPLAHSFARLMGYIGFLRGIELSFAAVADTRSSKADPVMVSRDMRNAGAKIVPIVPRLLEKIREGILKKTHLPGLKGWLLRATVRGAEQLYEVRRSGAPDPLLLALTYMLLTPMRRAIRRGIFGEHFAYAISGGAKLPVAVACFFDALGIEIVEGYGLTETCVATNVNSVGRKKIGTVGPVLASDIELRLSAEGEILFRGPNITSGYYHRPEATAAAWDDDGWFHTGDLGAIDADGYLSITGRKKEIIVTSGGKKIAPETIEQRLKGIPLVSQAVLLGEGRKYCVALLSLNEDAVRGWAIARQRTLSEPLGEDSDVLSEIQRALDQLNHELASFEQVKRFLIVAEFTIDNGLLTPTFKVKRHEVQKRYAEAIDRLYPE